MINFHCKNNPQSKLAWSDKKSIGIFFRCLQSYEASCITIVCFHNFRENYWWFFHLLPIRSGWFHQKNFGCQNADFQLPPVELNIPSITTLKWKLRRSHHPEIFDKIMFVSIFNTLEGCWVLFFPCIQKILIVDYARNTISMEKVPWSISAQIIVYPRIDTKIFYPTSNFDLASLFFRQIFSKILGTDVFIDGF